MKSAGSDMDPRDISLDSRISFVRKLGRALHIHGAPAHRLEESMVEISRVLDLSGSFFSSPTSIFSSLGAAGWDRTFLDRIECGEVDLQKLSKLDDLAVRVLERRTSVTAAAAEVDRIVSGRPAYPTWLSTLAFGLTSAAATRFFGGGAAEIAAATLIGLAVGLLSVAAGRWAAIGRLFEPLGGATVSFLALVIAARLHPTSVPIVSVGALIVLIPGLSLTLAVTELALRNLVSGTARLSGAVLSFLMLGFGVVLGRAAGAAFVGEVAPVEPVQLPGWTLYLAIAIASLTIGVLFRVPRRDLLWVMAACFCTFGGARWGGLLLGPELGVFLGAIVLGVVSNLYARLLRRPAMVTRLPALMLLVPGGLGFLGINSLLEQDALAGVQTVFTVGLIAVALVTGLLLSNALLPPRRIL